ncbi:MAG: hypothetical protein ACYTGZ_04245 [Planctomycetota bacterium]|jgi:predicted  nucleic acid-binding Zn-ribbon protein
MVIYVTSDDATNSHVRKLEDIAFKDERIGIGAKFFRCVKVSAANAAEDRLLKEHGKKSPRLIFVKRNYEVVKVLEGKSMSASKINKAMAKLAKAEYKTSYGTMQSKYAKLLNELDRLDDVRATIAADEKRYAANPKKYKSKIKKLAKKKAEYEKDMDGWKKSEESLLVFKPKEARRTTT